MKDEKLFTFTEVFEYRRGKRLKLIDQIPGDIAYISSTKMNNGIDNYVSPPEGMTIYKNKMTLTNSGSVGYLFYHDYEFVASDHVTVIWIKDSNIELNLNISLYLKPIFEAMRYKYNFGREINNERLEKEKILLPVNEEGQVDWVYIEDFIKDHLNSIEFVPVKTDIKESHIELNIGKWKEFRVGDLFVEFDNGKCSNASLLPFGDEIWYVGASNNNNGNISKVARVEELVTKGDGIVFVKDGNGSVGTTFYKEDDFIGTTNVTIGRNKNLNKYIGLFISEVCNLEEFRYSFGIKWNASRIKDTIIKLPAVEKENGEYEPNWNFMDNYIKSLPYSDKI